MMSGWWKNKEVAIRVANDNALTVDGLEFIEEAVTAMKYVSVHGCQYILQDRFFILLFCHVGNLNIQIY